MLGAFRFLRPRLAGLAAPASWRRRLGCLLLTGVVMSGSGYRVHAVSRAVEFEPYQIILDREPFGAAPPPPPDPPPEPPPEPDPPREIRPEESFARHLRLTFMVREESGVTRIGIINEREKKNYFMQVGDREDGIELITVDYDQERALLRYEDEEAWLSMRGDPLQAGHAGSMAPGQRPTGEPDSVSRHRRARPAPASRAALTREQYEQARSERPPPQPPRATLARQRAERSNMPEIPPDATPDERRQILREYNLELIRARGEKGPPLPIQLTDEEDAMLVEEGVLPPHE